MEREGEYTCESHYVAVAHTGEDAFFLVNSQSFELVVLDIMLPGRCGIEILSTMRKQGLKIPVLIVTAKDAIDDRVHGLDAGASGRGWLLFSLVRTRLVEGPHRRCILLVPALRAHNSIISSGDRVPGFVLRDLVVLREK